MGVQVGINWMKLEPIYKIFISIIYSYFVILCQIEYFPVLISHDMVFIFIYIASSYYTLYRWRSSRVFWLWLINTFFFTNLIVMISFNLAIIFLCLEVYLLYIIFISLIYSYCIGGDPVESSGFGWNWNLFMVQGCQS